MCPRVSLPLHRVAKSILFVVMCDLISSFRQAGYAKVISGTGYLCVFSIVEFLTSHLSVLTAYIHYPRSPYKASSNVFGLTPIRPF